MACVPGLEPPAAAAVDASPVRFPEPALSAEPARKVRSRTRQLPDVPVDLGLAGAVCCEASADDDPLHRDGYEHSLWLDEGLELAVVPDAFNRLEAAVSGHPLVDVAMHMDREVLYVAAPTLHPDDVRQLVLDTLADAYDPDWEQQF